MRIYRLSQAEFRAWRDHDARAELTKRVFATHGVTQIRAPSGRVLGTARQTDERVPIERAKFRAAHHAVRPGECMCREWQKPASKENEHHPICQYKAAWESQQVHDPDAPRERVVVSTTAPATGPQPTAPAAPAEPLDTSSDIPAPTEQQALATPQTPPSTPTEQQALATPQTPPSTPTEQQALATQQTPPSTPTEQQAPAPRPVPPPASVLPEPQGCVCRIWAGGISGQHHPLCQFRSAWEREHGVSKLELVELETGEVVREATSDEAAASKRKESEDGVGAIDFGDGKLYYVRAG